MIYPFSSPELHLPYVFQKNTPRECQVKLVSGECRGREEETGRVRGVSRECLMGLWDQWAEIHEMMVF